MIRAVILAAGVGARLRPLTDDRPKAMLVVDGEPLLARLARQLRAVGVTELVVATGHAEESVRGVDAILCRNELYATTQNVVSLHACREHLTPVETWKLDGDLFLEDAFLERLARAPLADDEMICAVERRGNLGDEEMKVELDGDRIVRFGKAIPRGHAESAGVERIGSVALSAIVHAVGAAVTGGETGLYYEDVYDRVLGGIHIPGSRLRRIPGIRARAVDIGDLAWTEIDTLADLQRAEGIARRLGA